MPHLHRLAWPGAALLALLGYYATAIEPGRIEVREVHLDLPRLHPAFDGYRLAQISDIHLGRWMTADRLRQIVALVNAQTADLIAITGDFVSNGQPYDAGGLTAALRALRAKDGVAAVLGNHDHKHEGTGPGPVRAALKAAGARELANAVWTLRRGEAALHLAGVDDVSRWQARLDLVLAQLPAEGAAILLAHEPDFAAISAATGRFDVQLSGHSHGGQVIIPLPFKRTRPLTRTLWANRYWRGLNEVNGMWLYVNRGLGMVGAPVRLNCRPEITCFTLRAGQRPALAARA